MTEFTILRTNHTGITVSDIEMTLVLMYCLFLESHFSSLPFTHV